MSSRPPRSLHCIAGSLTILFVLAGCGSPDPNGAPGTDGAVNPPTTDAGAADDAPTTKDAASVPVDVNTPDVGRDVASGAPDAVTEDVRASDDVFVVDASDAASAPDVLPVVDVPTRDVQCGPSPACVTACDEGRTRCVACAETCGRGCDMTGTACRLTCSGTLGTCLARCPSLSSCFASCNTLPAAQRTACLAACGLCTEGCTTTSGRCRTACDETEMSCGSRCEGTCASGADAGTALNCSSAQTACVGRCTVDDC